MKTVQLSVLTLVTCSISAIAQINEANNYSSFIADYAVIHQASNFDYYEVSPDAGLATDHFQSDMQSIPLGYSVPQDSLSGEYDPPKKTLLLGVAQNIFVNILVNRWNKWTRGEEGAFACVTWDSWKQNFETGLTWDWNSFGTNWFAHPYHGNIYFNTGRANGAGYWGSTLYTLGGSLAWEYLGETHPASGNDLVTTTFGGIFLGETMYRLSSNILDDSSYGAERTWREIGAALLNPVRGLSRLLTGETKKRTVGVNHIRAPFRSELGLGGTFGVKSLNADKRSGGVIQYEFLYGDPFDETKKVRKPMDLITFRAWIRNHKNEPEINPLPDSIAGLYLNIYAYAALWGKPAFQSGKNKHLFGIFQHYDYMNSPVARIGDMAITPGLVSDWHIGEHWKFRSSLQIGPGLLGGIDNPHIDVAQESHDPTDSRDYSMGPGIVSKADVIFAHDKFGEFLIRHGNWLIFIASGPDGIEDVGLTEFRYRIPFGKQQKVSLALDCYIYQRRSRFDDFPDVNRDAYQFRTMLFYHFGSNRTWKK